MNISIISLGKFKKKPPFEEIFNYYKKRINLNLDLLEIKTFNFEKKKKLFFEKTEIIKHLKPSDYIVVLDKDGKMLSSIDFSVFLKKKMIERTKRICFLIGSEIGLDFSLKKSNASSNWLLDNALLVVTLTLLIFSISFLSLNLLPRVAISHKFLLI